MKRFRRHLALTAALAALAVPACAPSRPTLQTPPPGWVRADEAVVWNHFDQVVELELSIADEVRTQPRLYDLLRNSGVDRLRAFQAEAREAQAGAPPSAGTPWTMFIGYGRPYETDRIFSLDGGAWSYSGGAHGNPDAASVLWDKAGQRLMAPADLFRPGADLGPLDRALCDAVNAAKAARSAQDSSGAAWDPALPRGSDGPGVWACPAALDIPFALAPGDAPGKAGGLIFLIDPYIVGPYAEAGYNIVVPLDAFAALLSPDWADQFAGAPTADTLNRYRAG